MTTTNDTEPIRRDSGAEEAAAPTVPVTPRAPRRGRAVPARWRIVGWILLTTVVALVAVVVTARDLLLTEVDHDANADIAQEVDEFRTFVAEGVDPHTAQPFSSVERMLDVYLARQYPSEGEILLGMVDGRVLRSDRPTETGAPGLPYDLAGDTALLGRIVDSPENSGVENVANGQMRWARANVSAGADQGVLVVSVFTANQRESVAETINTIALVAVGGVGLTAIIAWLVSGRILAPVRQVREVAAEIGEHDLSARVPVHGRDDIAALAETFNSMLDRLEGAYATQRRFVDDAGHELRTPITVVRGHLEVMELSGDTDPAERAETLRLVDDELARMARIVTDLLMLAKAEQPDFVQRRSIDVTDLTLDIEAKSQMLGDRNWQLMTVAEGVADVDGQRVTQAVLQLATNAVAHTRTGDVIQLGSEFLGYGVHRRLSVWVRDTGPGVHPDDAARIFERFRRGPRGPADVTGPAPERGGAGLGLAIVRAIADAHGGSAWVTSTLGHGATFGVDLPVPEAPVPTRKAGTT